MQNITRQNLIIGGILLFLTNWAVAAQKFTPGSQPTGWVSRPVVSNTDVSSGTEAFYQLDFHKDTWAGDVLSHYINATARIQTGGPWDNVDPTLTTAASLLNSRDYTSRKIATLGHAFNWANMTGAEKQALGSEDVLKFVRGDRSNEEPNGNSYYQRESVLGDIIHSNISYVDDGTNQSLYVGSNDGMLHAFDANTGAENWAYIPTMLIPELSKLANKNYVHTYFVDGPMSIVTLADNGKTVLVSALGAGGAGLFALDITAPLAANEQAVADKVLWEISATGDFSNLGHTYGTPIITRLNNGTAAVIIGNGYVNKGNGHAVLYVINANTGALISAIDTGSGTGANPNGLSSPALISTAGDSRPEYAYAGDIDGNLWKFDLDNGSASKIFTTSPVQAITTAPVVRPHPNGGQMIVFATGRILTSGDTIDTSKHYVYGVWDGAPGSNSSTVTQTLSTSSYAGVPVRTISNNLLDWSAGNDVGWKVELPPGERVVGEKPFFNNGRFYFLSTNPTTDPTENWLHELVFTTGGSPLSPIFNLSKKNGLGDDDLAANGGIPVAKYLGAGAFSQPLLVHGVDLSTTLYAFHQDLTVSDEVDVPDLGVSGGHFDFDIYYLGGKIKLTEVTSPTDDSQTDTICMKTKDIQKEYNANAPNSCVNNPGIAAGYSFLTAYVTGAKCLEDKKKNYQQVICNTVITEVVTEGDYLNHKHEHEYDDKYDVTGVNMLNASLVDFNLSNVIADSNTEFKVLVMNQYLNPAAMLSIGSDASDYINVKAFGKYTTETNAEALLSSLPTYTIDTVGTLIFNLPLDAFKSKDWWGEGGDVPVRAGLIPTQTGCVNKVNKDGTMKNAGRNGLLGPNDERFDGALTIQLIRADTPAGQLMINGPDQRYGWRVRQTNFNSYVLAEYTTFWHHPNKLCYGDAKWVPDPPEDFESDAKGEIPAEGSADPRDGIFGAGLAIVSVETTTSGSVTTTVTTYSDGSEYIKTETENEDGTITVTQKFRDTDEVVTTVIYAGDGGESGFVDPNTGSPEEDTGDVDGRQSWRDMIQ